MNIVDECKNRFVSLVSNQPNSNQNVSETLWNEIQSRYSEPHRYYHNLQHIYQMLGELDQIIQFLLDPEMFLYALFYHDLIYDPISKTNEEDSAKIAEQRLSELKVPIEKIKICISYIIHTKLHRLGDNRHNDTKYLLDLDLSILGSEIDLYSEYCQKIRKEYHMYSKEEYTQGRIYVLEKFLTRPRLYHTNLFFDLYEMRCRQNLLWEIHVLQKGELF